MRLVDAAYQILTSKNGALMTCREIIESAIEQGLIKPKSSKPWSHLQSALTTEVKKDKSQGNNPRFIKIEGKWKVDK